MYSKIICSSFEEKAKSFPERSFHACTCVGAFLTPGFLDPEISIQEMIRLVEEGGFVVLQVNSTEMDKPECKSIMKSLEASSVKDGYCECIEKSTIPNYLENCQGLMWILRKK